MAFRYPEDGEERVFRVVDVSPSGLGFLLDRDLPGLELGTVIRGVTLTYREKRIALDLLVLHVTTGFAGDSACGCLFYPESDDDLLACKEILAELALQAEKAGAGATS